MIAELFYPKELKQVIADLRAKDDLNEEALKSLNTNVYLFYVPFVFIGILILASYLIVGTRVLIPVVFWGGVLCSLPVVFWRVWKVYYRPYVEGEKVEGRIMEINYSRNGSRVLHIRNISNQSMDKIHQTFLHGKCASGKDDIVEYFVAGDTFATLHDFELMKKYSLKQSMLKGIDNA